MTRPASVQSRQIVKSSSGLTKEPPGPGPRSCPHPAPRPAHSALAKSQNQPPPHTPRTPDSALATGNAPTPAPSNRTLSTRTHKLPRVALPVKTPHESPRSKLRLGPPSHVKRHRSQQQRTTERPSEPPGASSSATLRPSHRSRWPQRNIPPKSEIPPPKPTQSASRPHSGSPKLRFV